MKILSILFLCLCPLLSAQLKENFENGFPDNCRQSPDSSWSVESANSISGKYSLHHSLDDSKTSFNQISLQHDILKLNASTTVWQFKIKHGYNPSSLNNWGVFLVSDRKAEDMFPYGDCNGYILGVNYSGSDDTIRIWKQNGNSTNCILKTGINWQTTIGTQKSAGFKIERDASGKWEAFLDTTGTNLFNFPLGSFTDTSITESQFVGIYYKFSSSQDRNLWFDDLYIEGNFESDLTAPCIKNYWFTDEKTISLEYSEFLDDSVEVVHLSTDLSGNNIESYQVNNNIITINFDQEFQSESSYSLLIKSVSDLYGNEVTDTLTITYYQAGFNDVIVTEIMADPNPQVQLPDAEYIEILNRAEYPVCLHNWKLCIGNSCSFLPSLFIKPKDYIVFTDDENVSFFNQTNNIYPVEKFPAITNSGQLIALMDRGNNLIYSIIYSLDFYKDEEKSNGGWSLEMIDTENPCAGEENWTASESSAGGTPGYRNSATALNPDIHKPEINQVVICDDTTLFIGFSEKIQPQYVQDLSAYFVENGIGEPYAYKTDFQFNFIYLFFKNNFLFNMQYKLELKKTFSDCTENSAIIDAFTFERPEPCTPMDIVINEILFDPYEEGGEFIELYNRSSRTVNLQEIELYIKNPVSLETKSVCKLTEYPFSFNPSEFVVLAKYPNSVINHYKCNDQQSFLRIKNFPVLSNDESIIGIRDTSGKLIDEVHYSASMIFEMINQPTGVSLERISSEVASNEKNNWHSSSADAGYATPGYINSQVITEHKEFSIEIEPEVFSPDGDEIDDIMNIHYFAKTNGFIANILIFDRNGRMVQRIAKNNLMGTSGVFSWDGFTHPGTKAPIGIYLIYIEVFNLEGKLLKFKKTCVVAERIQ